MNINRKLPIIVSVIMLLACFVSFLIVGSLNNNNYPAESSLLHTDSETSERPAIEYPTQTPYDSEEIISDADSIGSVETASPTAPPPEIYNASLTVVGDIMLHSYQLDDAYNKETGGYDFDYSFQNISKYLKTSDLTIGNLETVFGGADSGYTDFPVFNAPDDFAYAVKNAGFNLLTTANNHCNDRREKGILRTIEMLDSLGIEHVGTYESQESRDAVFIKEINNIKFAFLSYTYGTNGLPLTEGKDYLANIISEGLIKQDIEKAKSQNPDFIVILPHMGNEYELVPKEVFKKWAYFMLENGADIVLASHPHVLQPIEYVTFTEPDGFERDCFIAYSLGNFISSQRTLPRDAGIIFNLSFEKPEGQKATIKRISYIPTWVKFINSKGVYDITVVSVYDMLNAYENGEDTDLRPKDITRLENIHSEVSNIFLKKEVPVSEISNEYVLEKDEFNTIFLK